MNLRLWIILGITRVCVPIYGMEKEPASFLALLPAHLMAQISQYLPEDKQLYYLTAQEHRIFNKHCIEQARENISQPGKDLIVLHNFPINSMTSFVDNNMYALIKQSIPNFPIIKQQLNNFQIYDNKTGKRIDEQIGYVKKIPLNQTTTAYYDFVNLTCTVESTEDSETKGILHLPLEYGSLESHFQESLNNKQEKNVCMHNDQALNNEDGKTALIYDKTDGYIFKKSLNIRQYTAYLSHHQRMVLAKKIQLLQKDITCTYHIAWNKLIPLLAKIPIIKSILSQEEIIYTTLPDFIKQVINHYQYQIESD